MRVVFFTIFCSIKLGGGGDSLIKAGTDVRARALGFWQFLTRKCVIIDKQMKSDLLAENFQFWHFKS